MAPPTKVVGRRILAALIDAIPGFVIYWGLVRAMGDHVGRDESGSQWVMQTEWVNDTIRAQLGRDIYLIESGTMSLIALLALAYWIGVYVIWQGLGGVTIGKLIVGIRTVGEDGRPCGIGRAAARWAMLIVDAFPFIVPLVGGTTALASEGNRRVGDMVAKTYVIRADAVGRPVAPRNVPVHAGSDGAAQWVPTQR